MTAKQQELDNDLLLYLQENGPCRYQILEHAFDLGSTRIGASINRLMAANKVRQVPNPEGRRPLVAAV